MYGRNLTATHLHCLGKFDCARSWRVHDAHQPAKCQGVLGISIRNSHHPEGRTRQDQRPLCIFSTTLKEYVVHHYQAAVYTAEPTGLTNGLKNHYCIMCSTATQRRSGEFIFDTSLFYRSVARLLSTVVARPTHAEISALAHRKHMMPTIYEQMDHFKTKNTGAAYASHYIFTPRHSICVVEHFGAKCLQISPLHYNCTKMFHFTNAVSSC